MLTEIEYRLLQEGQRLLRYAAKADGKLEVMVERVDRWPDDEPLPDYQAIDKDGQYTHVTAVHVQAWAETATRNPYHDRLWEVKLNFMMSNAESHRAFLFTGKGDLLKDMQHMSIDTLNENAAILARFVSETIDKAKPHE